MIFIQIIDFYNLSKIPLTSSLRERTPNNDSSHINFSYSFSFCQFLLCEVFISNFWLCNFHNLDSHGDICTNYYDLTNSYYHEQKHWEILKITQNETEHKKLAFCFWVIIDHYCHFFFPEGIQHPILRFSYNFLNS